MEDGSAVQVRSRVGSRARAKSAYSRDKTILDTAIELTAELGWDSVNFKVLADRCGMSRTPLNSRFGNNSGLALAIWNQESPTFFGALLDFENALIAGEVNTAANLGNMFIRPSSAYKALCELMVASLFEPALLNAIQKSFSDLRQRWPGSGPLESAQRNYANLVAIGFLLAHKRGRIEDMEFSTVFGELAPAFTQPATPIVRPRLKGGIGDFDFASETDDPVIRDLLTAMLDQVGLHGYSQSDVRTVARNIGVTEGTIYSRFNSKIDLFLAATRLRLKKAFDFNVQLAQKLAKEHTFGVAQALMMFDAMQPSTRDLRRIRLEQLRLGWHSEEMKRIAEAAETAVVAGHGGYVPEGTSATSLGEIHWSFAMGLAVSLLPELDPTIADSHFEVVTIPIYASE